VVAYMANEVVFFILYAWRPRVRSWGSDHHSYDNNLPAELADWLNPLTSSNLNTGSELRVFRLSWLNVV